MSRATAGTGETTDTALAVVDSGSGETSTATRAPVAPEWEQSYRKAYTERYYPSAAAALAFPVVVAIHHASLIGATPPHAFIAGEVHPTKLIQLLRILTSDPENILLIGHANVMALTNDAVPVKYKFTGTYDDARCTAVRLRHTQCVLFLANSFESARTHKGECESNFPGATFYTVHYDPHTGSASLRLFSEANLMAACAQPALAVDVQKSTALSLLNAIKTQVAPPIVSASAADTDTRMAPAAEVARGVGLFAAASPAATAEEAVAATHGLTSS